MDGSVSSIYRIDPHAALASVEETITAALSRLKPGATISTFFRADDIGVPSYNFFAMTDCFTRHNLPLCLAVVPAWLTDPRWEAIEQRVDTTLPLWCWHQHGWSHRNHETTGKKYEFGPSRTGADIESDLIQGRTRLESVLGKDYSPFFTPPWNRCSPVTLDALARLQFHGVSRSRGEQKQPAPLPDLYINVDLHTRKEDDPDTSLHNLCDEFAHAIENMHVGIMLHHQRMDRPALLFLDGLLRIIAAQPRLKACDFNQLIRSP